MYTLTKWTIEDYHRMIETGLLDERSVELIKGEIIEMSPEGAFHCFINDHGVSYLRSLFGQNAVVREAHPITLPNSEPEPDIAIVRPPLSTYKNRHPYPEDIYWLIEIADSTLRKDLTLKKSVYAEVGIAEYWVIDLQNILLNVFQSPKDNDSEIKKNYQEGVIYPLAFPDIEIEVKKLLDTE
ncbi:MAG: Uma2 family endonuclease [Microcystaceae cyanobacterium]